MTDILVVLCTCPTGQDAERIAEILVQERLAGCVNLLPGVRSIYRWQGQIERTEEVLLFLKTTSARLASLRDRLVELHPYDTPEIVALPVVEGDRTYLSWLREQVAQDT
jgi:periplasmic divalent cation tolerance protein